jgi:hypothetical protein
MQAVKVQLQGKGINEPDLHFRDVHVLLYVQGRAGVYAGLIQNTEFDS